MTALCVLAGLYKHPARFAAGPLLQTSLPSLIPAPKSNKKVAVVAIRLVWNVVRISPAQKLFILRPTYVLHSGYF